jgi:hypothetical protein
MESINGYTGSLSNLGTAEQFFKVHTYQSSVCRLPSVVCCLLSAL